MRKQNKPYFILASGRVLYLEKSDIKNKLASFEIDRLPWISTYPKLEMKSKGLFAPLEVTPWFVKSSDARWLQSPFRDVEVPC
jgi:hypothetical protein